MVGCCRLKPTTSQATTCVIDVFPSHVPGVCLALGIGQRACVDHQQRLILRALVPGGQGQQDSWPWDHAILRYVRGFLFRVAMASNL